MEQGCKAAPFGREQEPGRRRREVGTEQ
jgi:hypothetical protein